MSNQMMNIQSKATNYIECLEEELCFVNDCFSGIQHILDNADTKYNRLGELKAFASTALTAFQNEIIITLSKLFDNTNDSRVISVYALISIFEKNKNAFDITWQKEKYAEYCNKFNIDDYVIALNPSLKFVSIEDAIKNFNESLNEYKKTIENIKFQRDKYYVHSEKKYQKSNGEYELNKERPLTRKELNGILQISHTFLTQVSMAIGKAPLAELSFGNIK